MDVVLRREVEPSQGAGDVHFLEGRPQAVAVFGDISKAQVGVLGRLGVDENGRVGLRGDLVGQLRVALVIFELGLVGVNKRLVGGIVEADVVRAAGLRSLALLTGLLNAAPPRPWAAAALNQYAAARSSGFTPLPSW